MKGKDYEKDRVRKWMPEWNTGRDWLMFDAEKNVMFCLYCREQKESSNDSCETDLPFVAWTDKSKLDNIQAHETPRLFHGVPNITKMHTNDKSDKSETPAGSALSTLTEAQSSRVVKHTVFLIIFAFLPIFPSLIRLEITVPVG